MAAARPTAASLTGDYSLTSGGGPGAQEPARARIAGDLKREAERAAAWRRITKLIGKPIRTVRNTVLDVDRLAPELGVFWRQRSTGVRQSGVVRAERGCSSRADRPCPG